MGKRIGLNLKDFQNMKRILDILRYYIKVRPACKKLYREISFNILDSESTIAYIIKNHCSVARFGDGELGIILSNTDIRFQKSDPILKKELHDVLLSSHPKLLVCLPQFLSMEKVQSEISNKAKRFWDFWIFDYGKKLHNLLSQNNDLNQKKWGDILISRPYMEWKHKKEHAEKIYSLLKKIWNDRDILIIEGSLTRMGVGNDLFANAKSIRRIIAPAINAFDKRSEIIQAVKKVYQGELILIALGPTATVLASDFAKHNMQAIDIGHVDIEYCWYLQKCKKKIPIKGKFVNECNSDSKNFLACTDKTYLSEIVVNIV